MGIVAFIAVLFGVIQLGLISGIKEEHYNIIVAEYNLNSETMYHTVKSIVIIDSLVKIFCGVFILFFV